MGGDDLRVDGVPALMLFQQLERPLQICLETGVGRIDIRCGCVRASGAGIVVALKQEVA